jgi:hypothetical protein
MLIEAGAALNRGGLDVSLNHREETAIRTPL